MRNRIRAIVGGVLILAATYVVNFGYHKCEARYLQRDLAQTKEELRDKEELSLRLLDRYCDGYDYQVKESTDDKIMSNRRIKNAEGWVDYYRGQIKKLESRIEAHERKAVTIF